MVPEPLSSAYMTMFSLLSYSSQNPMTKKSVKKNHLFHSKSIYAKFLPLRESKTEELSLLSVQREEQD